MSGGENTARAVCWPRQAARREVLLLLLCVGSDLLPRTLLSDFLRTNGGLWGAVVDNMSHAGVAAASWSVVVSLSPPPPAAAANFLLIALPGSPLHRCYSCCLARKAKNPSPPPPPPLRLQTGDTSVDGSRRDSDVICQRAPPTTPPPPPPGRRGNLARRASTGVVAEIILAACLGSALDLDHFLAAGSLQLSRATDLAGRPWGHCVAALVVAALALAALTHNARAGASIFTAGSSHQLRDATRRGLWLYPPRGPKTPPLGYPVYLLAQVLLPLSMALCLRCGAMPRCRRGVRGTRWLRGWRWPCAGSTRSGRGLGFVSRSGAENDGDDHGRRALLPK